MVKRKNYNWNKIRKEFQKSDLTYSAFSTEKGIPKSTAYAHLKDLIALKISTSNDNTDDDSSEESFDFVPIEVLEAEAISSAKEIVFIQSSEEKPAPQSKPLSSPIEIKIKGCSIALNQGLLINAT